MSQATPPRPVQPSPGDSERDVAAPSADIASPRHGLGGTALKGGVFLAGRHAVSLAIHLLGVTLLTRAIGPESYGKYVGALGVQTYLYAVSQLGLVVFLVRHERDVGDVEFDQAFTLLLGSGLIIAGIVFTGLPTVERWIGIETFAPVGQALVLVLPMQLLALVPMGRLERALNYRAIAPVELGGYVIFYAVALPLAHAGRREWAPVAGYWTQQVSVAIAMYAVARYRPRIRWEPRLIREMVRYGIEYSGAYWIWQLRDIVNPVIVGRFAGPSAVAFVALTVRLVDALSFLKGVGWRVSLALLGRLQNDRQRMVRAASDGMQLQVLSLGGLLAGFGLISHWAIPKLFGTGWDAVISLYPFVATGYLSNGLGQLETAMLNVVNLSRQVAWFHLLHVTLFVGTALVLVPRIGAMGYGWGEIAGLAAYFFLHFRTSRLVGRPDWVIAGSWWVAYVSLLFWQQLGWFCLIGPVLAISWPGTLRELRKYAATVARLRYVD